MNNNVPCVEKQIPILKSLTDEIKNNVRAISEIQNSIYNKVGYIDNKTAPINDGKKEEAEPQCLQDELQLIINRTSYIVSEMQGINTRLTAQLG